MTEDKNNGFASQRSQMPHMLEISRRKQILFSIIASIGTLLCLEMGIRVTAYFLYGGSPYFLFYGLKTWMADDHAEGHTVSFDGYFKFPPNRVLHQYGMFREPTPIRINSSGFRGADFNPKKPMDVYRVICLGESSTFGFFNRDDYTYPAILERLFTKRLGNHKVEVINAGIPHANSDNFVAMLKGELLGYNPDVLTIYSGYNDAAWVMDENTVQQILRWLHSHSATYVALKRLLSATGGPELYSRWATYRSISNRDYVIRQIDLHVNRYEKNIREIVSEAQRRGIKVILIKQPINVIKNQQMGGKIRMTYHEQVLSVQRRLEETGFVPDDEVMLLVHNALMVTLEGIAKEENISLIDNISILDEDPGYFASYVHLTEDGNRALARRLFETISPRVDVDSRQETVR